jgi:hypothetical protein
MRWRLEGVNTPEVDPHGAAKLLGIGHEYLSMMRMQSRGPAFRRLPNGRVRYSIEALEDYMTEKTFKRVA